MIGLVCSALAFLAAAWVARHEPRHKPIRDALGAALIYAIVVQPWFPKADDPKAVARGTLLVWASVAMFSGFAYLRAWSHERDPGPLPALWVAVMLLILPALVTGRAHWWGLATWGPFVASSAFGGWALWRWLGAWDSTKPPYPNEWTITGRTALLLLASDVCMLLFIPWPGVQVWQGRVSALVVAGVQAAWLIGGSTLPAVWTRYNALRNARLGRAKALRIAWRLRVLPVGKADNEYIYRSMFGG